MVTLNLYRRVEPHPGFRRLLEVGGRKCNGMFVFTSNVDGHFQKAGYPDDRIVECHGSIHHFQCTRPCTNEIWQATETVRVDEEAFRAIPPLPRCKCCGALARPNILMFGDWNWVANRAESQHGRFDAWVEELRAKSAKLVVIECGAGTAIPTVRATSERIANTMRGLLVRINPREPGVPPGHLGLALGAAEAIAAICSSR